MKNSIALLCFSLLAAGSALSSRPAFFVVDDFAELSAGSFHGTSLSVDGSVTTGPAFIEVASGLPGPVLAVTRSRLGETYAATGQPGRIWRLRSGAKPELVIELKEKALITSLFVLGPNRLMAVSAPAGGVHLFDRRGENMVTIQSDKSIKVLLDAAMHNGDLYIVGGGDEGVLLRLKKGEKSLETLATVDEPYLRSVQVSQNGIVYMGSDKNGVIYSYHAGKKRALFDSAAAEVTSIQATRGGRVYATIVDGDGKLSAGATKRDKDESKKKKEPRKIKSSEVVAIDADGSVEILWQSKKLGAYSSVLSSDGGTLYVGTGASGRLIAIDATGKTRARIVGEALDADELVSLRPIRAGLLVGSAHDGRVLQVNPAASNAGVYLSDSLDTKQMARFGRLDFRGSGIIEAQMRTGNTKKPDDTWSAFSTAMKSSGAISVPKGRYAQMRFSLSRGAELTSARLSYLPDNRAPEVVRLEVVEPGWHVRGTQSEASSSHSVSFAADAFKKYRGESRSLVPGAKKIQGKQVPKRGYRTVFAVVEDPDKDALRFRFFLQRADKKRGDWVLIKPWSVEPFVSIPGDRYADGDYRVRVEVDDKSSNGGGRALTDAGVSPVFAVRHHGPKFQDARATRKANGASLRFVLDAQLPLSGVQCAIGGGEWEPVDPVDGILDAKREEFSVFLEGAVDFDSAACEAIDEAYNLSRTDIPIP